MTTATEQPTGDTASTIEPTTLDPTARTRARRWTWPVLIVVAVLAVATLIGAISASGPSGYLQPDAATPEGAMALHNLLEQQGVRVVVLTDSKQAAVEARRGQATLFIPNATDLSGDDLAQAIAVGGDIVVTDPAPTIVPQLVPGMTAGHDADLQVRDPACALHAATRAGTALTGGVTITGQPTSGTVDSCYAAQGEGTVVRHTVADGDTLTIIGDGTAFTNAALADDGNAALALNLLGGWPEVVWYAPAPEVAPPADGQSDFSSLLPPWIGIVVAQLVVAVLAAALWRGRRLGPVVTEQLPVRVRAAETTEGRARMYRRRRARDRAAGHLRAACVARLTGPLGLPVASSRDTVVAQVAARSGWSAPDVAGLLYGAAPRDDAGLVRLASDLDTLERQVRRQ